VSRAAVSALIDVFVPLDEAGAPIDDHVARALGRARGSLGRLVVVRRALDARKGRPMGFRVRVRVGADDGDGSGGVSPLRARLQLSSGRVAPVVVIIGSGPAGTWCALRLAEAGIRAVLLERGKPVQPRRRDLAELQRGRLDPESNYCFGEGGAGTYSDGKLYTRSKDREGVAAILADLTRFGAPPEITVEARPHVGSNRLPKVLLALRAHLEAEGVIYRFETEAAGLRVEGGRVRAVRLRGGDELPADAVVLAVGHSARSAYDWLHAEGVALLRKPFALGVRMEHPQPVVDRLQYGAAAGHPALPPAFYELKARAADRSLYSFCMCPGGWIVPTATEQGGVVTNGMSLSRRDSPFANAGMVVELRAGDLGPDADGPLAGVTVQRRVEEAAFAAGGGAFRAPAVRISDLLAGGISTSLPACSYRPGLAAADLARILPPVVMDGLVRGLRELLARFPALAHPDALLVAPETRTSAPVRVLRDPETLESPSTPGLFPSGEGAGHAGGIVSAALDGVAVAEAIVRRFS
jgi:hypothetical protein